MFTFIVSSNSFYFLRFLGVRIIFSTLIYGQQIGLYLDLGSYCFISSESGLYSMKWVQCHRPGLLPLLKTKSAREHLCLSSTLQNGNDLSKFKLTLEIKESKKISLPPQIGALSERGTKGWKNRDCPDAIGTCGGVSEDSTFASHSLKP